LFKLCVQFIDQAIGKASGIACGHTPALRDLYRVKADDISNRNSAPLKRWDDMVEALR
jgi:hypothetical protein